MSDAKGVDISAGGDTLGVQGSERIGIDSNRFDPARIRPGDVFLGLEVVAVDMRPWAPDTSFTGTVRFRGPVTVSGTLRPHPDFPGIPEARIPCFYVDSTSALKLPRFLKDERFAWFCFSNAEEAEQMIRDVEQHRLATITIDAYQTVRQFSDVYDTARLVRIEAMQDSTTAR